MVPIGSIIVGAAASKNNMNTTGTPFLIPRGTQTIYLRTTATDVTFRSGPDLGSLAVPSALVSDANDFPLSANQAFPENVAGSMNTGPVTASPAPTWCVACYSTGGATVKVYGVLA